MFQVEKCLCLIVIIASTVYSDEDYKVRSISKTQYSLGHSPYWDVKSQTLYFVDIYAGSVISYKPSTRERFTAKIVNGPARATASLIIPYEGIDDKFVVGVNRSVANITWDGRSNTASTPSVIVEITDNKTMYSHTGKADPKGRLWIGTFPQLFTNSSGSLDIPLNQGAEYMISATGKVIEKIPNITAPEGQVWSTNTLFYFANCLAGKIQVYDYDNESGEISNMRVIFDAQKESKGRSPAGLALDTEGKIWVSMITTDSNYGTVIRIEPDSGKVLRTLTLPTPQLSNLVFGGENLNVLYVTSSQLNKKYLNNLNENAGRTFAVTGLMSSGKPVTGYPGQRIVAI
ncbi:regucalcin-like isoform X2 [Nilaparvata lugens]|uniref:regucalcin-like isoform X2 n=1 Tax=Nilaparvata lugens TaxID=108931 RepID=UPI00193EAAC9|nr:regucalcin-like isoform X2 [Nilaparvata lugens]